MQFLLIGDHPDGLAAAQTLAARGHRFAGAACSPQTRDWLTQLGLAPPWHRDPEEPLAQLDLDLVIVADSLLHRAAALRRALQSELNVLGVHPADLQPDIAYEAMMIVQETRKFVLPILAERLCPAARQMRAWLDAGQLGALQVVEWEQGIAAANFGSESWDGHPLTTIWDGLRLLGGEVLEVSVLPGAIEGLCPSDVVQLSGRFQNDALLHVLLRPTPPGHGSSVRCRLRGELGVIEAETQGDLFAQGRLRLQVTGDAERTEQTPPAIRMELVVDSLQRTLEGGQPDVTWQDATRCLELFEAARKSAKRRRLVRLEYESMSERGNFRSTMTALGCGVFLLIILFVWLTPLFSGSLYIAGGLLLLFLGLQGFGWLIREDTGDDGATGGTAKA